MDYRPKVGGDGFVRSVRRFLNGLGHRCTCRLCGRHFFRFSKFRGGWAAFSPYLREVKWTGSDFDRFWCPFCRCHDRERHLALFFDHLGFWPSFANAAVLHIAPERGLSEMIADERPANYVKGDLSPSREGICKIDVTQIPYADAAFDWVLCNHVLEHVPDDRKALSELFRVLKPGGRTVLQTPYAEHLALTREKEAEIDSDEKRIAFYGQEDHVRLYGRDLFRRIRDAGFELTLKTHRECLPGKDPQRYGVNGEEPLFLCTKPPARGVAG